MIARHYPHWIALALAHALLTDADAPSARSVGALRARALACLGLHPPAPEWLRRLTDPLARESAWFWQRQQPDTLAAHLMNSAHWQDALYAGRAPDGTPLRVRRLLLRPARMGAPPFDLADVALPALPTFDALAGWLGMDAERLHWLAHPALAWRENSHRRAVTPHYHCILRSKPAGGLRLIEAPKPVLKHVQRRLLHGLLAHIPVHEAAHGFVAGRGVTSHAAQHAGQPVVIAFDLRQFFTSISAARVQALWRTLGYPPGTAHTLTALCTARTPAPVRERLRESGSIDWLGACQLAAPHLVQGAPTSPALANLCAFGLDLRLGGLAVRFGARYSRYADDLVFSGPAELGEHFRQLHAWVNAIARAEGFTLNEGKTRRMPAHHQQRVTGLVVNQRPNLPRADYDRLRAELHRLGVQPAVDAALRAPLLGRIAWATSHVSADRAAKLRRLLASIAFAESTPKHS